MKISEVQQIYREQVKSYQMQKAALTKQLKYLRSRADDSIVGKEEYCSEAAALELTLEKLTQKQKEYQEYLNELSERYCACWNAAAAEQQKDAAQDYAEDMAKIMEVARRLMRGAIVPASDEKKLMEFSMEMYQTAKNVGAIAKQQKREKYDTLWGEEGEKTYDDPRHAAENAQTTWEGPEVVDASVISASAVAEGIQAGD
jgi:hypothetical protein